MPVELHFIIVDDTENNSPLAKKLIVLSSDPTTLVASHLKNAEGLSLGTVSLLLAVAMPTGGEITKLSVMSCQLVLDGLHSRLLFKHRPP